MTPYLFTEFFRSGFEDSKSPFLTKKAQTWAKHIPVKKAFFSLFCFVLSLFFSFFSPPLSLFFLASVYFLSGTSAILGAIEDLCNLEINIDTLMTLAAFIALFLGAGLEGALLLVLFELSGAIESSVTKKAGSALENLHQITPQKALIVENNKPPFEKSVRDIALGESIFVKVGEYIPLDGVILEGESLFDLAHLTGESLPVSRKKGDFVPAGAKNQNASVVLSVTKNSGESTLSRMIDLIQKAASQKPQIERTIDHFGKIYSLCVVTISACLASFLPLISSLPYLGSEGAIYRALTFLITASPCALVIGAPLAYLASLSACAKKGILMKGGAIFDAFSACESICFDKTGTLTSGKIEITNFRQIAGKPLPKKTALSVLKSLERPVTHPIANAVETFTSSLPVYPVKDFSEVLGEGVQGDVLTETGPLFAAVGNARFMETHWKGPLRVPPSKKSCAFMMVKEALFVLEFHDSIRKEARLLVEELQKKRGLKTFMLTGDEEKTAFSVAKELSIDAVFSHLKPEDKLDLVSKLSKDAGLIMVGDGMNDAPSLARATVGVALGKVGSSMTMEAADVVLLTDQITHIGWLLEKSFSTLRIVRQNLFLALGAIFIASSLALFGLMPLWLSVILHEGGTILVGCNSLRLLK